MIDQQVIKYLTLLKPEIDAAMGSANLDDHVALLNDDGSLYGIMTISEYRDHPSAWVRTLDRVYIPLTLPLPGQEAGRSLWEMVEGTDRKAKLTHITDGSYVVSVLVSAQGIGTYEADTPYLAILKALAREHGKEV